MAQHDFTTLLSHFKAWLSDSRILSAAQRSGFLERQSKLDLPLFVWTLLLGFSCGPSRSLASLHRCYQMALGCDYERTSFYRRFDASLPRMLRLLLDGALTRLPRSSLAGFDQILAVDATIIRLWNGLLPHFGSTQEGQSALKMQLVINVVDASPQRLKLQSGKSHEVTSWKKLGKWVQGSLLLMDLG